MSSSRRLACNVLLMLAALLTACGTQQSTVEAEKPLSAEKDSITLVIGAYSVAKDALQLIIPEFQRKWKEETGQTLNIQQSYEASSTQARSIAGGLEADVAILAMEGDMDKLVKAQLIPADWKSRDPYNGMVTESLVVIGTRPGNPLHIEDWEDLTREDTDVLYPNPKTSGGAQWDINAIYGAGLMKAKDIGVDGPQYAKRLLQEVHERILSMDKSGRASMAAFEYGIGDAIVTYENELLARQRQGAQYEIVVPSYTIKIENPLVVIDKYVDKHDTRKVAEAFVDYLRGEEAQELWVKAGFRSVLNHVDGKEAGVFTIEDMGGWVKVREQLYSQRGIWYQVLAGL